jgi:hypothetical protein
MDAHKSTHKLNVGAHAPEHPTSNAPMGQNEDHRQLSTSTRDKKNIYTCQESAYASSNTSLRKMLFKFIGSGLKRRYLYDRPKTQSTTSTTPTTITTARTALANDLN